MRRLPLLVAVVVAAWLGVTSTPLAAQEPTPVVETPTPFDSAGRVPALTPAIVSRLGLTSPVWPVSGDFREARLYRTTSATWVLAVTRTDGAVARYALSEAGVGTLRQLVSERLLAQGRGAAQLVGAGTGLEVSVPAGNAFVRNQTLLGLAAYGPATAALFSDAGGAASAGGYFLAAGASFFTAANLVKRRPVTRAQASRGAHGGTRGAIAGLGITAMTGADDAPAIGGIVLATAIGGTVVGYHHARGMSDGEAASAGLFADLGALVTGGLAGAAGAFEGREEFVPYDPMFPAGGGYTRTDNSLRGKGKAALAGALGAHVIGYAIGPRYARRAAYNVTAGDVDLVFTTALLGAAGALAIPREVRNDGATWGAGAAGLVAGAVLADRAFVRKADRSSADGTLAQLGALAGALMGGGVAALLETEARPALALGSAGGLLGMMAADYIVGPAPDAGPLRGVMQRASSSLDGRLSMSIGPVTSVRFTF